MFAFFATEFDLRERFHHALEQIIAVTVSGRAYKDALALAQEIAREALDPDTIQAWSEAGRPLPWLDDEDTAAVQAVYESFVEGVANA